MHWRQLFSRGVLVSYPKSGRTWLRVMLDEMGVSLEATHHGASTHGYRRIEDLPPPSTLLGKRRLVFLHRDPLDTLVSNWFHVTKHMGVPYPGTISDFIRDPIYGIEKIVYFNSTWLSACTGRTDALVVRYEDLHRDTAGELHRIAAFVGKRVKDERIARAVEKGNFGRMQEHETANKRNKGMIDPDPNSLKVRRGVAGGWKDYLSPEDAAFCQTVAACLLL